MKIVITGALGYIGSELCKIYSGFSRKNKVVAIDSRFISEKISQLTNWGIDFVQCDILDKKINEILYDADVVIHLAGITDVAYVNTQSDEAKDNQIKKVAIDGTRNILNSISNNCKIIFPSTHVVYEGFKDTVLDITENIEPCPVLTYSSAKVESEIDIKNSGKKYVILRLASVYGYSGDTMRTGIMPNLFSKIASQNGTIKLFSKGVQLKSLVPLIDVARCFKFMADSDISNETFHLSKETVTVKQVAELCKKINPKVQILETDDEIPNLGYTISNKKLLSTGFKFLYELETSISEMITKWSKKSINQNTEFIVNGGKEFIDERGKISNYELPEPINLIGLIESKAGTVRANHYHPIQQQKCLLIKGKYISVTKDLLTDNSPVETRLIKTGDIAVIHPNVAHTMVFLEDSIFLNLVNGEREHENYGITHTIPYKLVDEDFRKNLIKNFSTKCRCCESENLLDVISLGLSPLANNLLNQNEDCEKFPLELKYCNECKNCQLSYTVEPEKMFDNYLYVSSTASSFRKHFEDAAKKYVDKFNLNKNSLVVDIGSNDGVFLKPIKELGCKIIGVEPAKNISKLANENGIFTLNSYFNKSSVDEILNNYGNADIVTASNVFAHSDELKNITNETFRLLKENGTFIVEVQYLLNTLQDLTFDNIYHEHVNYWSLTSLNNFFKKLGFYVNSAERIETHGGSIRVYVNRFQNVENSVLELLEIENQNGLLEYTTYLEFKNNVEKIKLNVIKNLNNLKTKYSKIYAYGSPAKATTALNYFGIDNSLIQCTIEDNQLKHDKIIPGVNIPILSKDYCLNNLPELIIVLAWNFFNEIVNNNQDLINKGVKFISIKDLQIN
jgi:nucleoside-diphosphate-sugar epimerase/dTDP-4-dehydrorhamnose 3,5-epimerase-like enzyme/SAM-dependent methyltransferase